MAHALLYAPAPYPELGSAYGMMQVRFKVRGARREAARIRSFAPTVRRIPPVPVRRSQRALLVKH
jgi:hypothetical protein